MDTKKLINLAGIGFLIFLVIGFFLKDLWAAIKFGFTFTILFYIPLLPWTLRIKVPTFKRVIYTTLIGICVMPLFYAIIGFFTPLNGVLFMIPPLVVFFTGFYYKSNKI